MTAAIRQTYPDAPPALGLECHFQLAGGPADGVEFFLEHEGILYPRPIPADANGTVRLYPEASGRYVLRAFWRDAGGGPGRAELPIVIAGPSAGREPRLVHIDDRTSLWVPTEWDRQAIEGHERPILRALQHLVRPGRCRVRHRGERRPLLRPAGAVDRRHRLALRDRAEPGVRQLPARQSRAGACRLLYAPADGGVRSPRRLRVHLELRHHPRRHRPRFAGDRAQAGTPDSRRCRCARRDHRPMAAAGA